MDPAGGAGVEEELMWKRIAVLALALCLALLPVAQAEQPKTTEAPVAGPRVVDLAGCSDILKVMGFNVVGTTNTRSDDYTTVPSYLQGALGSAQVLGNAYQTEFDLDVIRALEPELILIGTQHQQLEPELKKIARTQTVSLQLRNWKMDMLALGEQLDRRDEVATWLDNYASKAYSVGQSIKKSLGKETRCLALMISAGQMYAFVDVGLGGILYNDLGMSRPTGMSDRMGINMTTIGFDQLSRLEMDHLFMLGSDADLQALHRQGDWLKLQVVKRNRVIELPIEPYLGMGYSCIGVDALLNELETMLTVHTS